jgi:hypothetical protein
MKNGPRVVEKRSHQAGFVTRTHELPKFIQNLNSFFSEGKLKAKEKQGRSFIAVFSISGCRLKLTVGNTINE